MWLPTAGWVPAGSAAGGATSLWCCRCCLERNKGHALGRGLRKPPGCTPEGPPAPWALPTVHRAAQPVAAGATPAHRRLSRGSPASQAPPPIPHGGSMAAVKPDLFSRINMRIDQKLTSVSIVLGLLCSGALQASSGPLAGSFTLLHSKLRPFCNDIPHATPPVGSSPGGSPAAAAGRIMSVPRGPSAVCQHLLWLRPPWKRPSLARRNGHPPPAAQVRPGGDCSPVG